MVVDKKETVRSAAASLRHRAEERLHEKTAEKGFPRTDEEMRRLFHELQVYQIELELQNEELLHTRDQVEASLLRYTDLYDFAPVSYFVLDCKGVVRSANLTAASLLGMERSLLIGRRFGLFIATENRPDFTEFLEKTFMSRVKESCEVLLTAGANPRFHVRIEAIANGEEQECRLAVIDISEKMRLEEQAVHLSSFPQLNPNPVLELDSSGQIAYTNPSTLKTLETLGLTDADAVLFLPVDMKNILKSWDRITEANLYREIVINGRYFNESITLSPRFKSARIYAYDFTGQKLAEESLQKAHADLEKRVADRTIELARSVNVLMEEIAERHKAEAALEKSARDIEDLYNRAPCGYHSLDKDGTFIRINDTALQWLGYDRDEVIGKMKAIDIETPESQTTFLNNFPRFLQNKSISDLRINFIRKDGSILPVLLNATSVLDTNGDFVMSRSTIFDISDLVAAEESIRKLNLLYLTLSDTGKAIASISDKGELFREICRIAVERGGFRMVWIGLLDDESGLVNPVAAFGSGTDYLDSVRINASSDEEGMGPTGIVIRSGGQYFCNDFMTDPNTGPWQMAAQQRGFLASAALALTQGVAIIGAITMYAGEKDYFDQQKKDLLVQMQTDISFALDNLEREARQREIESAFQLEVAERLRIVEELREKELMLLQQSRQAAMGDMINNIAHQWRQPLNTLGLTTQKLLLFYDTPEFNREFLQSNIDKSMNLIQHMSQTIESFRKFFRMDKEIALFDLNEIVLQTVFLIRQTFEEQKIAIVFKAKGDPRVYGYPNEYAQVLLNILINARDALIWNKVDDPTIVINTYMADETSIVTITDNAGGVADEIIGRLFEPYFTTKGPNKGTGIGLFMSKTIIENNMGGRLTVRNIGNGAEFRIEVKNGYNRSGE